MSYYTTKAYEHSQYPYDGTDLYMPVPGWGLSPRAAGPAKIGVGGPAPSPGPSASSAYSPGALTPYVAGSEAWFVHEVSLLGPSRPALPSSVVALWDKHVYAEMVGYGLPAGYTHSKQFLAHIEIALCGGVHTECFKKLASCLAPLNAWQCAALALLDHHIDTVRRRYLMVIAGQPTLAPAGFGAVAKVPAGARVLKMQGAAPVAADTGVPWWVYMAVPLVGGGILLFAADRGWLGGRVKTIAAGGKP